MLDFSTKFSFSASIFIFSFSDLLISKFYCCCINIIVITILQYNIHIEISSSLYNTFNDSPNLLEFINIIVFNNMFSQLFYKNSNLSINEIRLIWVIYFALSLNSSYSFTDIRTIGLKSLLDSFKFYLFLASSHNLPHFINILYHTLTICHSLLHCVTRLLVCW